MRDKVKHFAMDGVCVVHGAICTCTVVYTVWWGVYLLLHEHVVVVMGRGAHGGVRVVAQVALGGAILPLHLGAGEDQGGGTVGLANIIQYYTEDDHKHTNNIIKY